MTQDQYFLWLLTQWRLDHNLWEAVYSRMSGVEQDDYIAWLIGTNNQLTGLGYGSDLEHLKSK